MVDEMEGWSAPQDQAEDPYFGAVHNHHVSESEVEDFDLPKLVESAASFVWPSCARTLFV